MHLLCDEDWIAKHGAECCAHEEAVPAVLAEIFLQSPVLELSNLRTGMTPTDCNVAFLPC
jgi:hypothetical protein